MSLRDDLIATLHAENVLARRYFAPGCHRMEPSGNPVRLLATEGLSDRVRVLPTGTAITAQAITTICAIIRLRSSTRGRCGSADQPDRLACSRGSCL